MYMLPEMMGGCKFLVTTQAHQLLLDPPAVGLEAEQTTRARDRRLQRPGRHRSPSPSPIYFGGPDGSFETQ